MSENMEVAIERRRQAFYADRCDDSIIMLALAEIMGKLDANPALVKELLTRVKGKESK